MPVVGSLEFHDGGSVRLYTAGDVGVCRGVYIYIYACIYIYTHRNGREDKNYYFMKDSPCSCRQEFR